MTREKLELVEVSPRDGLQNEPDIVSTENKLALIDAIVAAGFKRLEAASFVNPKKVPQMADGDAVFEAIRKREDYRNGEVTFIALALNLRGVERALAAGAKATLTMPASTMAPTSSNGTPIARSPVPSPSRSPAARVCPKRSPTSSASPQGHAVWKIIGTPGPTNNPPGVP